MMADLTKGPVTAGNSGKPPAQMFNIQKIYLKDCSFEAPYSPDIFRSEWQPEVTVDLASETRVLSEHTYESVLKVTVTAKNAEQVAYICEVQQGAVVNIQGFEENTLEALLGSYTPSSLFPYAREAVSALISKGGFPAMVLQPVNFDALYLQKKRQQANEQAAAGEPSSDPVRQPN
jgi:preprotein translocase subunit SecB